MNELMSEEMAGQSLQLMAFAPKTTPVTWRPNLDCMIDFALKLPL